MKQMKCKAATAEIVTEAIVEQSTRSTLAGSIVDLPIDERNHIAFGSESSSPQATGSTPLTPSKREFRMTLRLPLLAAMLVCVIAPSTADATGCREWNRMSDSRKWDRIDRMIDDAISGQRGRSYQVNRNAIGRCLTDYSQDMFLDFNDLCVDSSTASMSAIRAKFKNYIWMCVS